MLYAVFQNRMKIIGIERNNVNNEMEKKKWISMIALLKDVNFATIFIPFIIGIWYHIEYQYIPLVLRQTSCK